MGELAKLFVSIGGKLDEKGFKDAEKVVAKLGESMKRLAQVTAAAIVGISVASIKAAADAEKAVLELGAAMKHAGTFTDEAFRAATQYASSLSKVTTASDESIMNIQRMLVMFGASGEQLNELTRATLDFATANRLDLDSAATLVAKSVGTSTNAMARYGVTVEGAAGSTERMQSATRGIAVLFGGSAAANAMTFSGRITMLWNALDEVAEKLGDILMPIVDVFISYLKDTAVPWLEQMVEAFKRTNAPARAFAGVLVFLAKTAYTATNGVAQLATAATALWQAVTLQWGKLGDTWKQLTDLTNEYHGKLQEVEDAVNKALGVAIEASAKRATVALQGITAGTGTALTQINELATQIASSIQETITPAFESLIYNGKATSDAMETFFNDIAEGFRRMIAKMIAEAITWAILMLTLKAFGISLPSAPGGGGGGLNLLDIIGRLTNIKGNTAGAGFAEGGVSLGHYAAMVDPNELHLPLNSPRTTELLSNAMDRSMNYSMGNITVNVNGAGAMSAGGARSLAQQVGREIFNEVKRSRRV